MSAATRLAPGHAGAPRGGGPCRSVLVDELAEHLRRLHHDVAPGGETPAALDYRACARVLITGVRGAGPTQRLWIDALQLVAGRLGQAAEAVLAGGDAQLPAPPALHDARELLADLTAEAEAGRW